MKKLGMIALALLTASAAYAQKGVEDGSRYGRGADSIEAVRNYNIYREEVKVENYKDAYERGWKSVFNDAPLASVNIYIDGVKILRSLYNQAKADKDEALMAKYSEELFKVYEQRIQYLDKLNLQSRHQTKEGDLWGQYGHDYICYNPKVLVTRAYEILSKAVEMTKGETIYFVLDDLMNVSVNRYKAKPDNEEFREDLINDYINCANYIDEVIAATTDEKTLKGAIQVKERIDERFVRSGAPDCESLQSIYGPKVEANKDNMEFLSTVTNLMSRLNCRSSEAYFTASEYMYQIEPSVKTAKQIGYLYLSERNDTERAIEFYNQAVALESEENKESLADLYYTLASLYMSNENYDRARSNIQKAISNNPKMGEPYLLLGQMYANKYEWTNDDALNRCAYFAAIDKLEQAKRVDSDSAIVAKANSLISKYKTLTPAVEDLFMLGYKVGDAVEIKGWINEKTTIR